MANYAIVIGINKYDWTPSAWLNGAVHDALEMTNWLLDVNGGNVPSNNLFLLLSPSEIDIIPSDLGVYTYTATKIDIINAIKELVRQSIGKEDRLFFYFAGHGFGAHIGNDQALIPSDFSDTDPTRSLSLKSILEYFYTTNFKEQFFFIDSCRNIPWDDFEMGNMLRRRRENSQFYSINQFVIKATSHGVKATEIEEASKVNGIFTSILLKGLKQGMGESKLWDSDNEIYLVSLNRLFNFIEKEIEKLNLPEINSVVGKLLQRPKLDGERDGSDPILAKFCPDVFSKEKLEVLLEPVPKISQMQLAIYANFIFIESKQQITTMPVIFELPPKTYTIQISLSNSPIKIVSIDLYTSQKKTIVC